MIPDMKDIMPKIYIGCKVLYSNDDELLHSIECIITGIKECKWINNSSIPTCKDCKGYIKLDNYKKYKCVGYKNTKCRIIKIIPNDFIKEDEFKV